MILNKKEREMLAEILRSVNGASVNEVPFVLNSEELDLLARLQNAEESKIYRIRFLDGNGGDRIVIAESQEEAEQIFTDNYLNPFLMVEVCEAKNGTFIG